MRKAKRQTFNDGVVKICEITDIAEAGDMPKDGLRVKETLRFHRRTVGVTRYYTAKQNDVKIAEVIRCPLRKGVSTQDKAVIGGKQYRIEQVQHPEDETPPVMDLSLERLEQRYEFEASP